MKGSSKGWRYHNNYYKLSVILFNLLIIIVTQQGVNDGYDNTQIQDVDVNEVYIQYIYAVYARAQEMKKKLKIM